MRRRDSTSIGTNGSYAGCVDRPMKAGMDSAQFTVAIKCIGTVPHRTRVDKCCSPHRTSLEAQHDAYALRVRAGRAAAAAVADARFSVVPQARAKLVVS